MRPMGPSLDHRGGVFDIWGHRRNIALIVKKTIM